MLPLNQTRYRSSLMLALVAVCLLPDIAAAQVEPAPDAKATKDVGETNAERAARRKAERSSEKPADWKAPTEPRAVVGKLVIVGGGKVTPAIREEFIKLAGGEKAKIVLIPSASASADTEKPDYWMESWSAFKTTSMVMLHTRSKEKANDPAFSEPIRQATGVWFGGGDQSKVTEVLLGTVAEQELHKLLARGGAIGGTSAGAALQTKLMITGGNPVATFGVGFDFLPNAVVDQHFIKRGRKPRLLGVLEKHPGVPGFGIDESTALVCEGRKLRVVGDSSVIALLPAGDGKPIKEEEWKPGKEADLFEWQRAAMERASPGLKPADAKEAKVDGSGTAIVVGGGKLEMAIVKRFMEAAGGVDAPIAYIPTALEDPLPARFGEVAMLRQAGCKNLTIVHTRDRAEADTEAFANKLDGIKGIWFSGGRQWRFVDAYENTKTLAAMKAVVQRGGVSAGSSAGATIQGDLLVRGSPMGNTLMMAEGYERGFAFLQGVAVDQHFTQRKRHKDLEAVVKHYPTVLGIGLDEGTALVVKGTSAEVMGPGKVFVMQADTSSDSANEIRKAEFAAGQPFTLGKPLPSTAR